jgi:hypothetical protein
MGTMVTGMNITVTTTGIGITIMTVTIIAEVMAYACSSGSKLMKLAHEWPNSDALVAPEMIPLTTSGV